MRPGAVACRRNLLVSKAATNGAVWARTCEEENYGLAVGTLGVVPESVAGQVHRLFGPSTEIGGFKHESQ